MGGIAGIENLERGILQTAVFFDKVTVNIHVVLEFLHEFSFFVAAANFNTDVILGEGHHDSFCTASTGSFSLIRGLPFAKEGAVTAGIDELVARHIIHVHVVVSIEHGIN